MGYDADAVVIVGLRYKRGFLRDALYTEDSVRGCEHPLSVGSKFCPECGVPTFKTQFTPIAGFDEGNDTLYGFDLIDSESGSDFDFVVCEQITASSNDKPKKIFAAGFMDAFQAELLNKFDSTALLAAGDFGVFLYLYESC